MNWSKITYEKKLAAITDILNDIADVDATFGWFKAILSVEPQPSVKYLDSCYNVISNLIKINTTNHSKESQVLHDRLVQWEKSLHDKEQDEKENEQTDDILQSL